MAKVKRPHVPISVKVAVACRQAGKVGYVKPRPGTGGLLTILHQILRDLSLDPARAQLDHRPPLGLRKFNKRTGRWTPDANDPDHMQWIDKAPHLERTAGRGGESMRFGGDTRAIAKVRRLEREPEKWTGLLKPKRPANKKAQKKRGVSRSIAARKDPWPPGRKLRSR